MIPTIVLSIDRQNAHTYAIGTDPELRAFICTCCGNQVSISESVSNRGKSLLCSSCQTSLALILHTTRGGILDMVQKDSAEK